MTRMAAVAEWTEMNLMDLYDGIDAGEFDIAVGGLATNSVRLAGVPFTIPYFERQYALIVDPRASPPVASFDELSSGAAVAVQRGTTVVEWAESTLTPLGVEVVEFETPSDIRDALSSGAVDAQVSSALYSLAAAGQLSPRELADAIPTGQVVAFAIDPEQPGLRAEVDEHLAAVIEDGTYQQIYDRWFQDESASVSR